MHALDLGGREERRRHNLNGCACVLILNDHLRW